MVFIASRDHWRPWSRALFGQLERASLSVQLNIAEGWTFSRSPTCTRYLATAYGSAVETGDLLELMVELKVLPHEMSADLLKRSSRCQRLLLGLLKRRRPLS
jgi:four helix bundle protein